MAENEPSSMEITGVQQLAISARLRKLDDWTDIFNRRLSDIEGRLDQLLIYATPKVVYPPGCMPDLKNFGASSYAECMRDLLAASLLRGHCDTCNAEITQANIRERFTSAAADGKQSAPKCICLFCGIVVCEHNLQCWPPKVHHCNYPDGPSGIFAPAKIANYMTLGRAERMIANRNPGGRGGGRGGGHGGGRGAPQTGKRIRQF